MDFFVAKCYNGSIKNKKWAALIVLLAWAWPVLASPEPFVTERLADTVNTQSIPIWHNAYIVPKIIINYVPVNLKPKNFNPYSCISYAKAVLGHSQGEFWGNAKDIKPTSDSPSIGAVVLLKEGKSGHAGVVINFTEEEITITESNYIPGKVTQRTLKRNYPPIQGYKTYPQVNLNI